ncbi:hypothetical protein T439DRAFT_326859 [Meredithblackwellia eburnea MCA 4105]
MGRSRFRERVQRSTRLRRRSATRNAGSYHEHVGVTSPAVWITVMRVPVMRPIQTGVTARRVSDPPCARARLNLRHLVAEKQVDPKSTSSLPSPTHLSTSLKLSPHPPFVNISPYLVTSRAIRKVLGR